MANRVPDSSKPPYNAVGLLLMKWSDGKTYQGSGALIASDLVLTCAHNVIDQKPKVGRATSVEFFPGWNSTNQPADGLAASKWAYPQAYQDGEDAWDVGLVKLKKPVAGVTYFFVPQSVNDTKLVDEYLTLAGYPGDKGGEMWTDLDQVAAVELRTNTVLFTHDTFGGSSGSPLYVYDSVQDVVRQYAIHNSQNQAFGLRRGLLITTAVHDWIASAVKLLGLEGASSRGSAHHRRDTAIRHAHEPDESAETMA